MNNKPRITVGMATADALEGLEEGVDDLAKDNFGGVDKGVFEERRTLLVSDKGSSVGSEMIIKIN